MERILIADDEPYILHVLAVKLRNAGYEVITAADGEEALHLSLAEKPDVIITDFQMPRLNGIQMARLFRERSQSPTPILLITAREFDLDQGDIQTCQIASVLAKPFSPRQVVHLVHQVLNPTETADPSPDSEQGESFEGDFANG